MLARQTCCTVAVLCAKPSQEHPTTNAGCIPQQQQANDVETDFTWIPAAPHTKHKPSSAFEPLAAVAAAEKRALKPYPSALHTPHASSSSSQPNTPDAIFRKVTGIRFAPWVQPKQASQSHMCKLCANIAAAAICVGSWQQHSRHSVCSMCMYCQQHRLQATARTGRAHCAHLHRNIRSDKLHPIHWQQKSAEVQPLSCSGTPACMQETQPQACDAMR
jgi:hypothetical protein